MINKISYNGESKKSQVAFRGNFVQKMLLQPKINKLEKTLVSDTFEICAKKFDKSNESASLLQKTSDFVLDLSKKVFRSEAEAIKRHSQVVKLAKINAQFDNPEKFEISEKLIMSAKKLQDKIPLTHSTFKDFADSETLYVKMMQKKGNTKKEILSEINNFYDVIRRKSRNTVSRLGKDNHFYRKNISFLDESMYHSDPIVKVNHRADTLLYGVDAANSKRAQWVKKLAIGNYELGLDSRRRGLQNSLEDLLLDSEHMNMKQRLVAKAKLRSGVID